MSSSAKRYKLSELAEISAGYGLRTSVDALDSGDISMIQIKNVIADTGVRWAEISKVSIPYQKSPNWLVKENILFAARNANNFAVMLEEAPDKTLCAPHFFVIRVYDNSLVHPHFLTWQINQAPAQAYFRKRAVGSTVMNIRRATVENLEVAVPTYATQEGIVRMWKASMDEKNILKQLIKNREQQMQAIASSLYFGKGGFAHD